MITRLVQTVRVMCIVLLAVVHPGCDDEFGDTAHRWVSGSARDLSSELVKADLKTRVLHFYSVSYAQIETDVITIEALLNELFSQTQAVDRTLGESPDTTAQSRVYRQSHAAHGALLGLARHFESLSARLSFLRKFGSRETFDSLGLAKLASESPLASVVELGSTLRGKNRDSYGFYISFSIKEDDEKKGKVGDESEDETTAEEWRGRVRMLSGVFNNLYAYLNGKKIREQQKRLGEAIELYYKLVLSPDEVYEVYASEVAKNATRFAWQHDQALVVIASLERMCGSALQVHVDRRGSAFSALLPYKVAEVVTRLKSALSLSALSSISLQQRVGGDLLRQCAHCQRLELRALDAPEGFRRCRAEEMHADALRHFLRNLKRLEGDPGFEAAVEYVAVPAARARKSLRDREAEVEKRAGGAR